MMDGIPYSWFKGYGLWFIVYGYGLLDINGLEKLQGVLQDM